MSKRILTSHQGSNIDESGKDICLFISKPEDNLYAVIIANDNRFEGL